MRIKLDETAAGTGLSRSLLEIAPANELPTHIGVLYSEYANDSRSLVHPGHDWSVAPHGRMGERRVLRARLAAVRAEARSAAGDVCRFVNPCGWRSPQTSMLV